MRQRSSGKGVGLVVPTLLTGPGSSIVHDIKGENWNLTAGSRAQFGRVMLFDPTNALFTGYNPLQRPRPEWIELADEPKRAKEPPGKESQTMTADPFNLDRFVTAQAPVFDTALIELKAARKSSHWMWFIFPQLRGLGHSPTAQFYGIGSPAEARAYLDHELLGSRLILCTRTVLESHGGSLHDIFGSPDDLKFRSSMTLFEAVAINETDVFGLAIDRWCAGERDGRTLRLISTAHSA